MAFELTNIVPWGRSFDEYVSMFALSEDDLRRTILGCGDGPASFNVELKHRGGQCCSLDPLYTLEADAILERIEKTFDLVIEQTRANQDGFVWTKIRSVEELGDLRMAAMRDFLADYPEGKREGRYVPGEAPSLGFSDKQFSIGLSSHFLFLYSDQLDLAFHLEAIDELCRVCEEVRIFPLLKLGSLKSQHVEPVIEHFTNKGHLVERVKVDYEFQKGGNEMLKITMSSSLNQPD